MNARWSESKVTGSLMKFTFVIRSECIFFNKTHDKKACKRTNSSFTKGNNLTYRKCKNYSPSITAVIYTCCARHTFSKVCTSSKLNIST